MQVLNTVNECTIYSSFHIPCHPLKKRVDGGDACLLLFVRLTLYWSVECHRMMPIALE